VYYFAYGVDLNKNSMLQHCPDSKPYCSATLPNYRLVFTGWSRQWHGATSNIMPYRGEKVRGALYEVTEQCLRCLDRDLGAPAVSSRIKITVFDEDNQPIEAITYLRVSDGERGKPADDYLALLRQGYQEWLLI